MSAASTTCFSESARSGGSSGGVARRAIADPRVSEAVLEQALGARAHGRRHPRGRGHLGQVVPVERRHEALRERARRLRVEHDERQQPRPLGPGRDARHGLEKRERHRAAQRRGEDRLVAAAGEHLPRARHALARRQDLGEERVHRGLLARLTPHRGLPTGRP
jgi:hypothetical protein